MTYLTPPRLVLARGVRLHKCSITTRVYCETASLGVRARKWRINSNQLAWLQSNMLIEHLVPVG